MGKTQKKTTETIDLGGGYVCITQTFTPKKMRVPRKEKKRLKRKYHEFYYPKGAKFSAYELLIPDGKFTDPDFIFAIDSKGGFV